MLAERINEYVIPKINAVKVNKRKGLQLDGACGMLAMFNNSLPRKPKYHRYTVFADLHGINLSLCLILMLCPHTLSWEAVYTVIQYFYHSHIIFINKTQSIDYSKIIKN